MTVTFTERELDVMSVLWERGSATVTEAREALDDDLAYTTVLTVFRTLEQKGHVRHEEEGKAHRYFPCVARERAGMSALRRMVDKLFAGSPEMLLTQLVSDRRLSDAEIRKIRALLDKRIRER
jgi:predicted transcriptional regulator